MSEILYLSTWMNLLFPRKRISAVHLRPHCEMAAVSDIAPREKWYQASRKSHQQSLYPEISVYFSRSSHGGFILFKNFPLLLCHVYLMISPVWIYNLKYKIVPKYLVYSFFLYVFSMQLDALLVHLSEKHPHPTLHPWILYLCTIYRFFLTLWLYLSHKIVCVGINIYLC